MNLPKWIWALPIAAIILIIIVMLIPKPTVDLEGLSCDEMLLAYDDCVKEIHARQLFKKDCKGIYVDEIINCYGEELLKDQLALLNASEVD